MMGGQAGKWVRLAGFAGLNGLALALVGIAAAEHLVYQRCESHRATPHVTGC